MIISFKTESIRIALLISIMAVVGLIMSGISIAILYETSFNQTRLRLLETARSRARLMEAIAKYDREHLRQHGQTSIDDVVKEVLKQIREAHKNFVGFGTTGEFTLGRLEGDQIVFLLRHRHLDQDLPLSIPMKSKLGEPMRQALLGRSGILIGLDYRNVMTLAAYEPVAILNMGVVAKIDMTEIRAPFIRAGVIVLGIGMLVIALGTALFFKVGTPLAQQLAETAALRKSRQELAEAQEALQEKAVYLDNVLRTSTDLAIVATDIRFVVKYFNPVAELLFGQPAERMLGRTIESIHADLGVDPKRFEIGIANVQNQGEHRYVIAQSREEGGRIIDSRVSGILDRNGKLSGFVLMSRDVTRSKAAEEALIRSERQYRLLIESANDAILIADAQTGIIIEANTMAGELLGRPLSEVIGMHQSELHPPEEVQRYRELFREHVEKGRGLLSDILVVHRDGSRIPVEIRAGVTDLGDRKVIQGIFRDISERQALEKAIQIERIKFQATFEQAAVGIAHVSQEGRFLLVNNRFCEVIGYTCTELETKSFQEITHPGDLEANVNQVRRMLRREISRFSTEKRCFRKNGAIVWVLLTVSLMYDQDGSVQCLVASIEDISERKQLEASLQSMNIDLERKIADRTRALERSNQDLQQFAYVASHDLQEPLRLISGYVQLLEKRYKGQLDAQADKYIAYTVDGARHMQNLISNLLTYSRVGTEVGEVVDVDLNQAVQRAQSNLMHRIRETGAQISSTPLPTIRVDAVQMAQVFQNLMGNALKFIGEGIPTIHISAVRGDGEWIVSVRDNGIGIEAGHRERIFMLFQKLHSRARYDGTGIGLALCKRIVERHGGHIWVTSEPGQGSDFQFSLPDRLPSTVL
ncbi:MAG: PAS domain S-box protein [Magnetococcales bacterium]|nr:PAS domain S-box protein [Magnetococcales bacterium]